MAHLKFRAALGMSRLRARLTGFPWSRDSARASDSRLESIMSAILRRYLALVSWPSPAQAGKAPAAALTASSTSLGPELGSRATTSSVAGFRLGEN